MNKKGLGRGLQALLPGNPAVEDEKERIIEIPVKNIRVSKNQPRVSFDEEKLNELALSIKEHGVVQPIIVRTSADGKYEIVAGERRWRACKKIGIEKIPAVIKKLSEKETSEISLIENIQREDLNPIEEAMAYRTLMNDYKITQEELARRVGKSRPFIANAVRLLSLPDQIKSMIARDRITAGHARALLGLTKAKEQEEVARKVLLKGLSVRQTEKEVKDIISGETRIKRKIKKQDPVIKELEDRLKKKFSTKVHIKHGKKSGKIEIEYYGDDELQRLLETLLGEIEI